MEDTNSGLPHSKSYLIKDTSPDSAFNIFKEKMAKGSKGLCVTRTNPKMISGKYSISPDTVWFGSQKVMDSGQVDTIEEALMRVEHFLNSSKDKESIILLERLDYLITVYGFEETLKFIYSLKDIISFSNSTLLVHLNPSIISSAQYKFIEQEIGELEPRKELEITEDLKEIISLIREDDKVGRKVSFKDVTRAFSITKTTARKRIGRLSSLGIIEVRKKGRLKLLRLKDDYISEFAKDI